MSARAITVSIIGNASQLQGALGQAEKASTSFAQKAGKAAKIASVAIGGALLATAKAGLDGLREGEEAEAAFARTTDKLKGKVKLNTAAFQDYAEQVQKNTRFSYEDTLAAGAAIAAQDGLQHAVKNGVASYEQLTQVALDLATQQGTDSVSAAGKLAKALAQPEKAAGALKKMGIQLTAAEQEKIKVWTKAGDVGKAQALILDQIKDKTKGAAEAAGATTTGKIERMNNAFGEMQESLASALLPAMEKFVAWGSKISTWAQDNPGKVKAVVMVVGGLAATVGVVVGAMKVWKAITIAHTAVMAALNVVMFMNPIGLVVAAIGLLVAAFVIAYKKSDTFREIVDKAMRAVKNITIDVIKFVVDKFLWYAETILWAASKAFGWVPGLGGKLKKAHAAIAKFRDDTNRTLEGLKDQTINIKLTASQQAFNAAYKASPQGKAGVNGPFIPTGGGGGAGKNLDGMPASGGPVRMGGMYLVGERGPELFVPGTGGSIVPNGGGRGGGSAPIHLTINQYDEKGALRKTIREIVHASGGLNAAFGG